MSQAYSKQLNPILQKSAAESKLLLFIKYDNVAVQISNCLCNTNYKHNRLNSSELLSNDQLASVVASWGLGMVSLGVGVDGVGEGGSSTEGEGQRCG